MRYLVLSDVHANLEALEAVLAAATGKYEATLFLGDLIGYGPNPNECVARMRELPGLTALTGNHDLAALGRTNLAAFNPIAQAAARWTAATLTSDARDYLLGLPPARAHDSVYLAHASPRDPIWEYMEFPEQGPPNFAAFEASLAFVGHTHVPRIFESVDGHVRVGRPDSDAGLNLGGNSRRILNPGGVGQPRDGDPRAAYGLWDTEAATFTWQRQPYDLERTQKKILAAGLPAPLARRLSLGL